ncbi:hypothetical protein GGX14DRAFT_543824 [Mycena pura]|uniref:Uncharacterized protein n=1 Tax=Mycena pura TaxID=153505 RepID=A0AAD6VGG2_9AGAR|nr:hypothetical protein GGX14DRAFT_543824 [Mycena pura]
MSRKPSKSFLGLCGAGLFGYHDQGDSRISSLLRQTKGARVLIAHAAHLSPSSPSELATPFISMQSTIIVDPTPFNLAWTSLLCGLGLALVLYGLYVNLFILAIYTLCRRKTAGKNVLLAACCTMFILGTTEIILLICTNAMDIRILQALVETGANLGQATYPVKLSDAFVPLGLAGNIIFVINKLIVFSLVTDLLFVEPLQLYRCYKIWGSQKVVILLPATLILSIVVIAFVNIVRVDILLFRNSYARAIFAMCAVTNLVLVVLTAGRIWWIQRGVAVHVYVDDVSRNRYRKPIALVLESGALYCIWAILLVVLFGDDSGTSAWFNIISSTASQMVNIVPTLIVVRVGLGHNVQDSIPNPSQYSLQSKHNHSRQVQVEPSNSKCAVINMGPVDPQSSDGKDKDF